MDGNVDPESLRKYAWDYFSVHANQRMSVFNFFVALAVLMTGALFGTFHRDFDLPALGVVLGIGLAFVSFIFWKLDQRAKYLVKNAEAALADVERHFPTATGTGEPHVTQLVRWEEAETRKLRTERRRWSPLAQFSYAQSFNLLFGFFAALGLIGTALSVVRLW